MANKLRIYHLCISRGKESDKERIKLNEEAKERKLLIMWFMMLKVLTDLTVST